MKTLLKLAIALVIVSVAVLYFVQSSPVAAGNKPTLSKKEVKALIAGAKNQGRPSKAG
jgi:hypothetical protein